MDKEYKDKEAMKASAANAGGQAKETDLSKRLRMRAESLGRAGENMLEVLLTQAAEEIERYYGGMLAWKRTAGAKDAEFAANRAAAADAGGLPPYEVVAALNSLRWMLNKSDECDKPNMRATTLLDKHHSKDGKTIRQDLETLWRYFEPNRPEMTALLLSGGDRPTAVGTEGLTDTQRLEWMAETEGMMEHVFGGYRIFWPRLEEMQADIFPTPQAAIDAAMQVKAAAKGAAGQEGGAV